MLNSNDIYTETATVDFEKSQKDGIVLDNNKIDEEGDTPRAKSNKDGCFLRPQDQSSCSQLASSIEDAPPGMGSTQPQKSIRKSLIVGLYENAAIIHQTEAAQSTSSVMMSQKTN